MDSGKENAVDGVVEPLDSQAAREAVSSNREGPNVIGNLSQIPETEQENATSTAQGSQ